MDWDVYDGNGTQHVYYARGDVLTVSLHQDRFFPPGYSGEGECGEGAGANINIPLPAGSGHDAYLAAVRMIVVPALEKFRSEIIVVASGLDANAVDPLARQLLHSETFREMTQVVLDAAKRLCGGRLVVRHEGGHAEAYRPYAGLAILEALSGVRTSVRDPVLAVFEPPQPRSITVDFQLQWAERLRRHFGFESRYKRREWTQMYTRAVMYAGHSVAENCRSRPEAPAGVARSRANGDEADRDPLLPCGYARLPRRYSRT